MSITHREHEEESKLAQEWRHSVTESLKQLDRKIDLANFKIESLELENAKEHAEVSKKLEVMFTKLQAEIDRLNESLIGKNRTIKILILALVALGGILAEAKGHISALLKAFIEKY